MQARPSEEILKLENLKKYFSVTKGLFKKQTQVVKAVDGVSFSVFRGETLGLVGESGCGKSTLGRVILRLYDATSGTINFEGEDITNLSQSDMRPLRKKMQVIFQDPYASLNPRMTVGNIIGEALDIHKLVANKAAKQERIAELLSIVGLRPESLFRYPHEFSGGQRQRIGIARALSVSPEFIVCDEPVSALDVSIQAQIVNLLQDLQEKLNLTYIFIAHDLHVVRHISTRVAVMYLGDLVELACAKDLYDDPKHPYTRALLSAVPVADPSKRSKRIVLKGEIPSPMNPPSGCKFHTRCPEVMEICHKKVPPFIQIGKGRQTACHLYGSST